MEKDRRREGSCDNNCAQMAITKLLPIGNTSGKKGALVPEEAGEFVTSLQSRDDREFCEHSSGSMPLLDGNLKNQGFSRSDIRFLRKA